jgi:galactose mutarotase-like enzyme
MNTRRLLFAPRKSIKYLTNTHFLIKFKDLKSKSATLRNRKTGKALRVDFPDDEYFLLWHKPNAPYICLEPWAGIPDMVDSSFDITEKEGIIALDGKKEYNHTHSITIVE